MFNGTLYRRYVVYICTFVKCVLTQTAYPFLAVHNSELRFVIGITSPICFGLIDLNLFLGKSSLFDSLGHSCVHNLLYLSVQLTSHDDRVDYT